jgi:hypothetical protein
MNFKTFKKKYDKIILDYEKNGGVPLEEVIKKLKNDQKTI